MIAFRNLKRASLAAGLGGLFLAMHLAGAGAALAQSGSVSIATDRSQYQPGDSIQVCYTVAGPGPFTIIDTQANGNSHTFFAGVDDGTGGCLPGTVTPPYGTECLSIYAQGGYGGSAQTCFQVLGQTPPPTPPPANQNCGKVTALNGHVISIGAQGDEDCFYHSYLSCSPYSLDYDNAEVDSGTRYTFELQANSGGCTIVETVQNYTLPLSSGLPIELGSCSGVTETQFGLIFTSCQGGGNVVVPNS